MRKENDTNFAPEQAMAAINAAHLLHPAMHFDHPRDVLTAEGIGKDEKRAILASWASDMSAIESMPALRRYPGMERIVSYDEILEALKALDRPDFDETKEASLSNAIPTDRRTRQRRWFTDFRVGSKRKGGPTKPTFDN
jgi:hypothetical protein